MGEVRPGSGVRPLLGGGVALSATPNPSRGTATVTLSLDTPREATVVVVDVLGREVARLHNGPLAAGTHQFSLDAAREGLRSGIYVVRATAGSTTVSQRLTVVR